MNEKAKDKPWSRPWTSSEIIENAENWSLAGDAALLNTLKSFGDKILTKANETNSNLNSLTENLEEHTLRLDLIRNKFDGLRNTQFIESRVYEEDETLHIDEEPQQKEEIPVKEEDKLNELKGVVEGALNILDKYYEEVEVDISDSEDDTEVGRYVYQLKDPYMNRRLPHIIGSEQWHQKWHVGLKDSSSEIESEQSSESFSESDSDEDFPTQGISKKNGTSGSSSDLDLISKADISQPAASSTFNASKAEFASSSDSGQGSLPVQAASANVSFAEQLSAKLGTIMSQKEDNLSSEINTAPIQKSSDQNKYPGIFFDEPPPLEETPHKTVNRNLYTGEDLFGGDDNTSFWGEEKSALSKKSEDNKECLISPNNDEIMINKNPVKSEKNKSKGFFDDSESDDDLFKVKKPEIDKPYLSSYLGQPKKTAVPFNDEPPELSKESKEVSKKKPVGGISVLGKSVALQIGSVLKNRPRVSSESSEEEKDTVDEKSPPQRHSQIDQNKKNTKIVEPLKEEALLKKSHIFEDSLDAETNRETKKKAISLFDDDDNDDFLKDDLFSNIASGKTKSKLFDDDLLEDSLFGTKHNVERTKNDTNNIFNKIPNDNKNDIRSVPTKKDTNKSAHFEEPKNVKLFDEEDQGGDIFSKKNSQQLPDESNNILTTTDSSKTSLNETNKNLQQIESDNLFKKDENKKDKKSKLSLFDDSDDSNDELFNIDFKIKTNVTETTSKAKPEKEDKKTAIESIKTATQDINFASSKENDSISSSQLGETSAAPASQPSPTIESESQSSQIDESSTASAFQPIPSFKSERSHSISLFDPTPPPDDVNWGDETQSNQGDDLFLEEELSDGTNPGHGMGLGIASLDETSGFGRDYLTLTDETERYSFYPSEPEASSSRRLSSDIFSEQQSDDMFFITTNKTDSNSLQPIPEIDNQMSNSATSDSVFNITPSGNIDDLFSSDLSLSKPTTNSDSLFDDNIQDDLFGSTISSRKDLTSRKEENTSAEINQKVTTIENNKSESENNQQREKIKPPGVPGKLRHNLNINVSALLPGSAPPKRVDLPVPKIDESVKSSDPVLMGIDSVDVASVKNISQSASEKIFGDDNQDSVKTLHSVTKDRPRIQVKRRPSTRKGRKELRSEHISDTVDANKLPLQGVEEVKSESLLSPLVIKQKAVEATIVKLKTEPDNLKSDDENIFSGVDEKASETVDNFTSDIDIFSDYLKKEQSIVNAPKPIENSIPESDFFNETIPDTVAMKVESEDDLFSGEKSKKFENKSFSFFDDPMDASLTSRKELSRADENISHKKIEQTTESTAAKSEKKDSFGIFDEEDDDIFSNTKNSVKAIPKMKNLFGDESDEENDGLFSSKTASAAGIPKDTKHAKKNIKPTVRKLENTKVEYDPLSNLLEE